MVEKTIKYIEIFEFYRDKILNGEMVQDEKLPTEQEIDVSLFFKL